MSSVTEFYDSLSTSYDSVRFRSPYARFIDRLERAFILEHCRPGRVLEIGAGTGRMTASLAEVATSVTAIDASVGMLDVLRQKVRRPNVRLHHMTLFSIEDLADFGSFDTVVCFRTLPHIPRIPEALSLIQRALRPGGGAIFDLWSSHSLYFTLRKALRRGRVFTQFLPPAQMLTMISPAGLQIDTCRAWGYLLPLRLALDRLPGGRLSSLVYAIENLGRTRLRGLGHSLMFSCVKRPSS